MGQLSAVFKGDKFRCTQTLSGESIKGRECDLFKEGNEYQSHNDGCITDESGNRHHEITPSFCSDFFELIPVKNHIKKWKTNEAVYKK